MESIQDINAINDPEILIKRALLLQSQGMHLQARSLFNRARELAPDHSLIHMFFRVRVHRRESHDDYYEEPVVECCCCPGYRENLSSCVCKAMCCDFCCIPGGCCLLPY